MAKYPKKPKPKKLPKTPKAIKQPKESASLEVWERYNERLAAQMKGCQTKAKEVEKANAKALEEWKNKCKEIDQRAAKKEAAKKKATALKKSMCNLK